MEIKTTPNRKSLFILVTILIIVVVSHAQNLFLYPYYQDVEGTQIANGWSMATKGELSPYSFSYEEPPVGTFVMSAWLSISGGLSSFGFPINSGRTLMLILHVLTVALIYGIAKKTYKSDLTAAIAAIVFSFSPLAPSESGTGSSSPLSSFAVTDLIATGPLPLPLAPAAHRRPTARTPSPVSSTSFSSIARTASRGRSTAAFQATATTRNTAPTCRSASTPPMIGCTS